MTFRISYTRDLLAYDRARNRPAFYRFVDVDTVEQLDATMAQLVADPTIVRASWERTGAWWVAEHPIPIDHRGFDSADDQRNELEISGAYDPEVPVADIDDRIPPGFADDEYCPASGGVHKPIFDEHGGECEHCGRPAPRQKERAEP